MKSLREALFNKKSLSNNIDYLRKYKNYHDLVKVLCGSRKKDIPNLLVVFNRDIFSHNPINITLVLNTNIPETNKIVDDLVDDNSIEQFAKTDIKTIINTGEIFGINFFNPILKEIKYAYLDLEEHKNSSNSILKEIRVEELIDITGMNYDEIISKIKEIML